MSHRTIRSVKRSCDSIWSQVVRAGGECERCGKVPDNPFGFHAHHCYGRKNHRLRFEPRNGVALCYTCHRWAEEEPLGFADWFRSHRPDDAEWLMKENQRGLLKRSLDDYLELERDLRHRLGKGETDGS